jgi:hypothetical protein
MSTWNSLRAIAMCTLAHVGEPSFAALASSGTA